MKKWTILLFISLLQSLPVWSATLWVNPAGSATAPYDTKSKGLTTIQAGMAAMSGGDTLIITNGTYTGASNVFAYGHMPPIGSAGAYTTVQAETAGSAIIDGEGARSPCYYDPGSPETARYWKFDGIVFRNSNAQTFVITCTDYVKVTRCGFGDAGANSDNMNTHTCAYWLVEDCYSWGNGRYHFHYYNTDYSIFRRCVVRHDKGSYTFQVGMQIYDSQYIEVQNCIVIDSDQTSYYNSPSEIHAYKIPQVSGGNINFTGCFSLNNNMNFMAISTGSASLTNCVAWNTYARWGVWTGGTGTLLNNNTLGVIGIGGLGAGGTDKTAYSTLFYDCVYGIYSYAGSAISDYNNYYGNDTDFSGATDGAHDYCAANSNAINPIWAAGNTSGGLKYLPRIETGSNLSGLGSGSTDIGANVIYCTGKTGTMWGETDYNTLQDGQGGRGTEALWPFPYESTIKTAMQAWTASGQTGDRGFASSTDKQLNGTSDITLTSYIWEYLGNQMPSDIYGSSPSTPTITGGFGGSLQ